MSRNRSNTEEFIEKSENIHGKVYDYSLVNYVSSSTKVNIVCRIHGQFEQKPNHHLNGHGCKKCHDLKRPQIRLLSTKDFIIKAKKIHGNKYDYRLVNYTGNNKKIVIICDVHGEFEQIPSNHLNGHECNECAKSLRGWTYDKWEKSGNNSFNFDSFKLYVIRCYNDNEVFYKIGKTFKTIDKRFDVYHRMPYKFDIIKVIKGSARDISNIERELHKENKSFKYIPKIKFRGMNECFSKITT